MTASQTGAAANWRVPLAKTSLRQTLCSVTKVYLQLLYVLIFNKECRILFTLPVSELSNALDKTGSLAIKCR
jgi:hypothetical protein